MSGRDHVQALLRSALAAVDPRNAVRRSLRLEGERLRVGDQEEVDLAGVRRVVLLAAGKAAAGMVGGAMEVLGERVSEGVATVPRGVRLHAPRVEVWEASHPVPDAHGLAAAAESLHLARSATADDLVLCLLSGGASALWPAPPDGVSLGDLRRVTGELLRSGASIAEVNAVRKHLSRAGGGGLARAAAPARVLTLAISDVVGGAPDAIGSGPTVPDPTTFADALGVLTRYRVAAPPAVLHHLQAGAAGEVPETLKPGEAGVRSDLHLVAELRDALDAAAAEAARLGYAVEVVTEHLQGEARVVAGEIARAALEARQGRVALLWGGETTVSVQGDGRGGRNQELALAAALALAGRPGITVAAFGTDGVDGPTDAAGAVVDGGTPQRARAAGLDPEAMLHRNDAYPLLRATGDLLITGPTGTNVGDLVVALVE